VTGVGGKKAAAIGRGTVTLISNCNGVNWTLKLEDVLHVPGQKNNLISLGRWDKAGGTYLGGDNKIILITKDGKQVAEGTRLKNFLYGMNVTRRSSSMAIESSQTFEGTENAQSWETWHKRYGHIGYSGLQKILDNNMVEGLEIDMNTPKPDCVACTEAKQNVEPFPKENNRKTQTGDLTHIDLWGKYSIKSINGNHYYVVMIDDAQRYISVEFLKEKNQASQAVINYLTYLKARGRTPKAIQIDRGREFVNEKLERWCKEQGIELRLTAPYSPPQNGVAERMNRTLTELARANLNNHEIPEYLWEYAISHAAYIRNRAYTKRMGTLTPFQGWFGYKPYVAHLREFGAPVWILLQGQKEQRKMLPKSKRRIYVGYDDGSKSVKYYNAETRKVLTSRNFKSLNLAIDRKSPEPVVITPDILHEGESGADHMPQSGVMPEAEGSSETDGSRKRKRSVEIPIDVDINEPRKTRGLRPDYRYCYLNNIFGQEDDEEETNLLEETYAIIAGDELNSLEEAKSSLDWPEWRKAIDEELKLLEEMGTWILVEKPEDAIAIPNKWTFVKKRNKINIIVRHRARLVVKGCVQRPGHEFMETYSPVVRAETLRVCLALVPVKGLKVKQMDIKGAYLNGILQETVYMKQPEGYEDGTGRVCKLIKTLYGLKQSGREWNKQLDEKLRSHGYKRLISDPCAYVRWDGDNVAIITVWVDDLLLFASNDTMMEHMKNSIESEWQATDLGEPSKIIGIEITMMPEYLRISQGKYIDNLLRKENMAEANPVGMPLDPNIKIGPNPEHNEPNRSNSYAKLLGELQYVANATRPDISYAVNKLAAYTANPSLEHYGTLKRILRYLAGTKNHGITYRKPIGHNNEANLFHGHARNYGPHDHQENNLFHGFADAAFANTDDYKSTTGYVFLASEGAITWKSKKQTIIAMSSTESEYVALSEAGREAFWLRNLYDELGFPQMGPTVIKSDNEGSVILSHNPQFHARTKHIEIRHHWVRDLVNNKILDVQGCRDPEQTADILTKPLPKPKHQRHRREMGLEALK